MTPQVASLRSGVHILALLLGLAALPTESPAGHTQPLHGCVTNLSVVIEGGMIHASYDMESDGADMMFMVRAVGT